MLSLGFKFCAFPRCSRACFSLRRRAALSSEVCPAALFFFAARQKAHKPKMQYSPCENTFCQGARSRRRRRNEENKTKTGVSKTSEIQVMFFIGFPFVLVRKLPLSKLLSVFVSNSEFLQKVAQHHAEIDPGGLQTAPTQGKKQSPEVCLQICFILEDFQHPKRRQKWSLKSL